MASIDADGCFLSAVLRSYLFLATAWPVMIAAAAQDSTSNNSVQPGSNVHICWATVQRLRPNGRCQVGLS